MDLVRGHRSTRGQILFLEFMATLPIFALLFIAATAFHIYYKRTRAAYGEARLATWTHFDRHWSGQKDPQGLKVFKRELDAQPDKASAENKPEISHIKVEWYESVVSHKMRAPSWLGDSVAVGTCYANRDAWGHGDIRVRDPSQTKVWNDDAESMPYIFFQPSYKGPLREGFLRL